jgi:hypothetical protein
MNKEKLLEKMHEKLDEYYIKIDNLERATEAQKEKSGEKFEEMLNAIKAKKENLERKKDEFKNSGEAALADLKSGFEKAALDLENAITNALDRIKSGK